MKIILLTTDTTHHLYYAWKISERHNVEAIFLQTKQEKPKFKNSHPFEIQRDEFESDYLLSEGPKSFSGISTTHYFYSLNDKEAVEELNIYSPDILLVFGTQKLSPQVYKTAAISSLNLHGGDPELYRGLDSHLWAIYNNDFDSLVTTLHHIDSKLDTGNIAYKTKLGFPKNCQLFQLRSINTQACVDISLKALDKFKTRENVPSKKQLRQGRYYSFMPSDLKEECVDKFEAFTSKI